MSEPMSRIALLYSDGSLGVLADGATIDDAVKQRVFSDAGERDPARMSKIARVGVTVIELVDEPPAAPTAVTSPGLRRIAEIIEHVDHRCMATDGPVTPTLKEMTQEEISRIYALATGHEETWKP